ncbi:hypothetical protein LOZ66_000431 [Ophidiomyces ophidiicola]|nr:hypothetical protein LOZ65_004161 [Ophidiomyces ophidiicola]KAI1943844.1 hypothetical protein LOZ66_000431 [Ophidiomyces ophidiicola]
MDRDRYDRRYDDGRRGGESYRPADRVPRHTSRPDIRFGRSPVRNRSPPALRPTADTWAPSDRVRPRSRSPNTFRRRSRSPPFRGGDRPSEYGARPRSPPPRRFSPRRENGRSPPRLPRRSRSPAAPMALRNPAFPRNGSPGLKRTREMSPAGYIPRSPKRERITNSPPRNRYERPRSPHSRMEESPYIRPRSPGRREPWKEPYGGRVWRRRSPSPPTRSGANSGPGSSSTSRRSSPPPRMDRRGYGGPPMQAPMYSNRPQSSMPLSSRTPPHSNRFTPRQTEPPSTQSSRPVSPPRGPKSSFANASSVRASEISPAESPNADRDFSQRGRPRSRGTPAHNFENDTDFSRQNYSQPASSNRVQGESPPPGPTAPRNPELASRGGHAALLSAPTRPKGGSGQSPYFNRESGPRESIRGGMHRRPGGHGPPYHHQYGGRGGPPSGASGYESHRPAFRHGSSSSTTYPRTQRFTNHLSGLPNIVPGGKLLPSNLDPAYEKRIAQLEADKERLLEQIAEKQKAKRTSLREWDKLARDGSTGALRSELADGQLQRMAEGDDISGAAF